MPLCDTLWGGSARRRTHIFVALLGRDEHRRGLGFGRNVHISSEGMEEPDHVRVPVPRGGVDDGGTVVHGGVHVGSKIVEEPDHVAVAFVRRVPDGSGAVFLRSVNVRTQGVEKLHHLPAVHERIHAPTSQGISKEIKVSNHLGQIPAPRGASNGAQGSCWIRLMGAGDVGVGRSWRKNLPVAGVGSDQDGGEPVVARGVDVGTEGMQETDHVLTSVLGGEVHGSAALLVREMDLVWVKQGTGRNKTWRSGRGIGRGCGKPVDWAKESEERATGESGHRKDPARYLFLAGQESTTAPHRLPFPSLWHQSRAEAPFEIEASPPALPLGSLPFHLPTRPGRAYVSSGADVAAHGREVARADSCM